VALIAAIIWLIFRPGNSNKWSTASAVYDYLKINTPRTLRGQDIDLSLSLDDLNMVFKNSKIRNFLKNAALHILLEWNLNITMDTLKYHFPTVLIQQLKLRD